MKQNLETLNSAHEDLSEHLNGLIQFKDSKKLEMEKNYSVLKKFLESVIEKHNQTLHKLSEKDKHDCDLLKKESINRINQVATEFRRVSNLQMADITKRTNIENEAVSSQIFKLEEKEAELLKENELLRSLFVSQNKKLIEYEADEKCQARKNHCAARLISLLTERTSEIEIDLVQAEEILGQKRDELGVYEELGFQQRQFNKMFEDLKEYVATDLEGNIENLNRELAEEKQKVNDLRDALGEMSIELARSLSGNLNVDRILSQAYQKGGEQARDMSSALVKIE